MQIYSVLQKGESHPIFCEDFLYYEHLDQNRVVAAVMDGCSSGKDSHFPSTLMGKVLQKIVQSLPNLPQSDPENDSDLLSVPGIGKHFAKSLFDDLARIYSYLLLDYTEFLSTIILLVYDQKTKDAWVLTSGDGYVSFNDEITYLDQQNRPDYLTYHLHTGFEEWFEHNVRIFHENKIERIAISTDGIGSFFNYSRMSKKNRDPVRELLTSKIQGPDTLQHLIKSYKVDEGLLPYDDISIIRVENAT